MSETAVATLQPRQSLVTKFAAKYTIEPDKLLPILKATAFKVRDGEVSNEQMAALLVVADQYGLNPFTREIFAFPDKQNGIVPVVGVDGWSRIVNDHPQSDGFEFRQSDESVTPPDGKPCPAWMEVVIHRKDRGHPIVVREYLDEVYRPPFKRSDGSKALGPWQTHTKRFLRHKVFIQGARIAYGFGGIFDEDEAERIIERDITAESSVVVERSAGARLKSALSAPAAQEGQGQAQTEPKGDNPPEGQTGQGTPESPAGQGESADKPKAPAQGDPGTAKLKEKLLARMKKATDLDVLQIAHEEAGFFVWSPAELQEFSDAYQSRLKELRA